MSVLQTTCQLYVSHPERSPGRGSFITGQSAHKSRIERVFQSCTILYYTSSIALNLKMDQMLITSSIYYVCIMYSYTFPRLTSVLNHFNMLGTTMHPMQSPLSNFGYVDWLGIRGNQHTYINSNGYGSQLQLTVLATQAIVCLFVYSYIDTGCFSIIMGSLELFIKIIIIQMKMLNKWIFLLFSIPLARCK